MLELFQHPILTLRTLLFYVGYLVYLTIHGTLVFFLTPFMPQKWKYEFIIAWAKFNIEWLRLTCGISYTIEGLNNIQQPVGVVLSKHQSGWETFLLQSLFKPQTTVIKKELLWIPIFGQAIRLLNPIVVDRSKRSSALKELIRQGTERLQQGYWIVLFPEGTRVHPGETSEFSAGGAMLASNTKSKVIPVAHNSGEYWRAHGFLKYPGEVKVVIGEPISVEGKKPKQINKEVQDWIELTMRRISSIEREAQEKRESEVSGVPSL